VGDRLRSRILEHAAHPRYATVSGETDGKVRPVACIMYELFQHPAGSAIPIAFSTLSRSHPAIADLHGVWRRTLAREADGSTDCVTTTTWVQGPSFSGTCSSRPVLTT
jgi:hypothetical protein